MALAKALRYAVLHVGSSSMSITIMEYKSIDDVRVVDKASREVTFGEEVFQTGRLSFQTIEELCRVLRGYKQLMADYGVVKAKLYGTTVIREAANRRIILDQIFIHTGMRVEVIDMPKEVYYKYFLLYHDMRTKKEFNKDEAMMFLDITSGGVGITVWRGNEMLFQRNIHSGSLRVIESFKRNERAASTFPEAVAEYVSRVMSPLREELREFNVKSIVFAGDEARMLGEFMGYDVVDQETLHVAPHDFYHFVDSFHGVTVTKLINRYGLPEFRANILMPTIILYNEVMHMITPDELLVSGISFSEGISLLYGVEAENHPYLSLLREQNVQLARAIARRYRTDAVHDREVERFSVQISAALKDKGFPERWGYLGRIASILCSVGKYVNLRNHGEHAYHIVMGTDIFGLSEEEKEVVANVVYYHYKGTPSDDDEYFRHLTEFQKIQVTKLVAVIRIACSLDAGSNQKISSIDIARQDEEITITAHTNEDISLEAWTFKRDAEYFANVFGMSIQLVMGGAR